MESAGNSKCGFKIVIVGAGIAGLAAATALTRNGKQHNVTILESHPSLNEFGASIVISPNGIRSLRSLGLESEFAEVVMRNNFLRIVDGMTGEEIGYLPQNAGNYSRTNYGDENWTINRRDCQNILADAAQAGGAKIVFDVQIDTIDVEKCMIACQDGQTYRADVIIGADGMKSTVRKHISRLSHVEPVAWITETAYRCTVPKSKIIGNPLLQELVAEPNTLAYCAPGKYVLGWPMPSDRPFDLTLRITEPGDIPLGKWGSPVGVGVAISQFQDFCPKVKELLSHVDRAVKWTLGELPPLETCVSENGRVLLIGDAWHAMLPHSASGGNSAVEDAVSVAECLEWAWQRSNRAEVDLHKAIAQAARAFEDTRKPRVERLQRAAHEGYAFLKAEGEEAINRKKVLAAAKQFYDAELALSEEERMARQPVPADMNSRLGLEPYFQWAYRYDAAAETREYLASWSRSDW